MSAPTAYYASTYVNLLFDYLQDQGLDAVHVLGESSPNCQEVRLYALDHWRRLLERAAEVCNDPLLGLHVGQRIAPAHLGVLGYALGACPDVGAVLQRWQQYDRVVANVTACVHHGLLSNAFDRLELLGQSSLIAIGKPREIWRRAIRVEVGKAASFGTERSLGLSRVMTMFALSCRTLALAPTSHIRDFPLPAPQ